MGSYRIVVRHIRYWRGNPHKWSTVYPAQGNLTGGAAALAQAVLTADDAMCFGNGLAANGGTYEADVYNQASGGVPIGTYRKFDPTSPGSWLAYGGTAWSPTPTSGYEPNAEVALQVEWPAGFSTSGKPVFLRKWYHAVPITTPAGNAGNISTALQTALRNGAQNIQGQIAAAGLALGTVGRLAGTPAVNLYFGNHQMPRGRRKKILTNSEQRSLLQQAISGGISSTSSQEGLA